MIRVPDISSRSATEDRGGQRKTLWLISFTDLISLMLAFFVLMYSMSEPEAERWTRLAKGV
ncbi:MAG: flagellar motor protein MotB, partial [Alphaproteobacteria bacterium]